MIKNIVISLTLLLSFPCWSLSSLNFGTYVPYFNKAQVSDSGASKKFELNPFVSYSSTIPLGTFSFIPEFGLSMDMNESPGYQKDYIFIRYMFGHSISPIMQLRYGLSTTWIKMTSEGGSTSLNNGGSTSTYYYPGGSKQSYITTLDGGLEWNFKQIYTLRFDLQIMSFTNFDKWNYNYILGISRYF
jgi:hypothetical protein